MTLVKSTDGRQCGLTRYWLSDDRPYFGHYLRVSRLRLRSAIKRGSKTVLVVCPACGPRGRTERAFIYSQGRMQIGCTRFGKAATALILSTNGKH